MPFNTIFIDRYSDPDGPCNPDNAEYLFTGGYCSSILLFPFFLFCGVITIGHYLSTTQNPTVLSSCEYIKDKSLEVDLALHDFVGSQKKSSSDSSNSANVENGKESWKDDGLPSETGAASTGETALEVFSENESVASPNGEDKNSVEEDEFINDKNLPLWLVKTWKWSKKTFFSLKESYIKTDKIKLCQNVFWILLIYYAISIPFNFAAHRHWKKIREKAILGDVKCQLKLGYQFLKRFSKDMRKNDEDHRHFSPDDDLYEAYFWFSKAAMQGDPEAWYWVANIHEASQKYDLALEFYSVSADLNYEPAKVKKEYIENTINLKYSS